MRGQVTNQQQARDSTVRGVRGWRSGRLRSKVLVVARHDGEHYLVSILGEDSDWVRNIRAAGGQAFVNRGRWLPMKLTEVPVSERGPILKAEA